jgi:hypothetical protein
MDEIDRNWIDGDWDEPRARVKGPSRGRAESQRRAKQPEVDYERYAREVERRGLDVRQFRAAMVAGGFRSIYLKAAGPNFMIQGEPQERVLGPFGVIRVVLVTTRGRSTRFFCNPAEGLAVLKKMGVERVTVELESWLPHYQTERSRVRPDMAERFRAVHAGVKQKVRAAMEAQSEA